LWPHPAAATGRGGPPIDDDDKEHAYEPGDSDVRPVARRHFHAPGRHGLGSRGPGWPLGPGSGDPGGRRGVQHGPGQEFPIDVTFPGEGEPDQVDTWITAHADPFYIRAW